MKVTNIVINSEPIKVEHVSWYTLDRGDKVKLVEVVRKTYVHPDSQGMATISQLEEEGYIEFDRKSYNKISHIVQLEAALNTVSKLEECSKFDKKEQ